MAVISANPSPSRSSITSLRCSRTSSSRVICERPITVVSFAKQLEHQYIKPALRRLWPRRHKSLNGIRVNYLHHLDGGGSAFGQEYIPYLRNRGMPRQSRAFEWCAGPGFIGFSLLGCGLTETLCLADINPEAVEICRRTVDH